MYHGRLFPTSQMKKEALKISPNVPQRERRRWKHPPTFPRKKGGVGDIPQCSPAKRALLSFNLGFTGDEKEGFKDFIKQKKSVELDKKKFFLMFIPLKYQVS